MICFFMYVDFDIIDRVRVFKVVKNYMCQQSFIFSFIIFFNQMKAKFSRWIFFFFAPIPDLPTFIPPIRFS